MIAAARTGFGREPDERRSSDADVYLRADGESFIDAGFKVSASVLRGAPAGGFEVDSPTNMEFRVAAASQYLAGK